MKKNNYKMIAFVITLLFCGHVFATDVETAPFTGVTHIHRTLDTPRPLNINIVIIDLNAEGISFKVTPSNGDSSGETNVQNVMDFVSEEGAQIGINGGFFYWDDDQSGYEVMGYAVSEGDIYSYFTEWSGWPTPYVSLNISSTNQADIIYPVPSFPIGQYVAPFGTEVYNAVPGSEWIVKDGESNVSDWYLNTSLHPRSAAGITSDDELILLTVDGRQSGFSEGMYVSEVADLLIELGAVQGLNLDGGGSSTMVFADPLPRLVNVPINGGTSYSMRKTANNLVVFAQAEDQTIDKITFNDFEDGDEGRFAYSPGYSGSTQGIVSDSSTADPVETESWNGSWAEKLYIQDDSSQTGVSENPDGGWFVRWVSGASASPSQNIQRPLQGCVGFWIKTESPGISVSICLDNSSQMERGIPIEVVSDGYWHCCQWDLEDPDVWEGWYNGDGQLTGSAFTLDSIHILGPDEDAELFIDDISHDPNSTLNIKEDCEHIWKAGEGLVADFDLNCVVDVDDLALLGYDWLETSDYNIDLPARMDLLDFKYLAKYWLQSNDPAEVK